MILNSISLVDFRCFFGKTEIELAQDNDKNVTIIYAENGVGKTTLLNAMLWCFFGKTTSRFEREDELVNYDALRAGRFETSVKVGFNHNNIQYLVERTAFHEDRKPQTFTILKFFNSSWSKIPQNPEGFINSVLPEQMAGHFLFDGEFAENFVSERNQDQIKDAVRDILGCRLIENSIADLEDVTRSYRSDMRKIPGDQQIRMVQNQIEQLENRIQKLEGEEKVLRQKFQFNEQQIEDIDRRLRDIPDTRTLQERRHKLEQQKQGCDKAVLDCQLEVYRWVGDNSRYVVSKRAECEVAKYLDIQCDHGRIPAPYNEQFVKSLLEKNLCVCGRDLIAGTNEYSSVEALMQAAGNKVQMDRVFKIKTLVSTLNKGRTNAPETLRLAKERLAKERERLTDIEHSLGVISTSLRDINLFDVQQLELKRRQLQNELYKLNQDLGSNKNELDRTRSELGTAKSSLAQESAKNEMLQPLQARIDLCEKMINVLTRHLNTEEERARETIQDMVRDVIDKTSRKNFTVDLDSGFLLRLLSSDSLRELPKSSGENQLLSLAFTAALVNFAKQRDSSTEESLLRGTIAPLVLDSPFGQLDTVYRKATAQFIPRMARQVVLLLSRSQGDAQVLEELFPFVGKEFVLIRHNKDSRRPGMLVEVRELHGVSIDLTVYDSTFDGTQVMEVGNGVQ